MIKTDRTKCTKCKICLRLCPFSVLITEDGYPVLDPEKNCLECYHCVAACPSNAISSGETQTEITDNNLANKNFLNEDFREQLKNLILNRRSIRHYQDMPYPHYKLKALLETVRMAPSAKNQQAVKWAAVVGKDKTKKVMDLVLKWVDYTGNNPELKEMYDKGLNVVTLNAPTLIFVYADEKAIAPEIDCTIALTTAELLLQAEGVGTCHAGYLRRIANADDKIRKHLAIPDGCQIYGALTVGYPEKEEYKKIPHRNEPNITWI